MKCSNCEAIKSREEVYLDITLPVKGFIGMKESLSYLFNYEEIINDYKCDDCNKKVDLLRYSKLKQLPIFINFNLNRFSFDFETFERIKLNDKFEFPLEINMRDYLSQEVLNDYDLNFTENNDKEFLYELYGIIIHRGTPYSGHYFSYIRDIVNEGNWNLDELKEYKNDPEFFNKDIDIDNNNNNNEKNENENKEDDKNENEINITDNNNNNNKNNKGKKNNNKNNKNNQGKKNNNNNNKKSKTIKLKNKKI
jgi:uncharacterized UBP type Zn finger protein